jgi:hypothetical protein
LHSILFARSPADCWSAPSQCSHSAFFTLKRLIVVALKANRSRKEAPGKRSSPPRPGARRR